MADVPKRIKRLLHGLAAEAHEEELRRALAPLAGRSSAGNSGSSTAENWPS